LGALDDVFVQASAGIAEPAILLAQPTRSGPDHWLACDAAAINPLHIPLKRPGNGIHERRGASRPSETIGVSKHRL